MAGTCPPSQSIGVANQVRYGMGFRRSCDAVQGCPRGALTNQRLSPWAQSPLRVIEALNLRCDPASLEGGRPP